jgi:hypothetical protein
VVNPGDKVSVKLIEIDAERRRISLSIKQTTERPADLGEGDDFVPIDASGEGLDLDGPSTSMAAALREAASRARGEDEASGEEAAPAEAEAAPAADAVAEAPAAEEAPAEEPAAEAAPVEEEAPAAEPEADAEADKDA